jgi:hypothetical protein
MNYTAPDRKMIADVELDMMRKEAVVAYLKENSQRFPGDTEGDNKK